MASKPTDEGRMPSPQDNVLTRRRSSADERSSGGVRSSIQKLRRRLSNDSNLFDHGAGIVSRHVSGQRRSTDSNHYSNAQRRQSDVSESNASATTADSRRLSVWGRMNRTSDIWKDEEDEEEEQPTFRKAVKFVAEYQWQSMKRFFHNLITHPKIILLTVLTLAALCGMGIGAILVFSKKYEEDLQTAAIDKAEEIGYWVSRELDKALLPLFTMAQFVQHLDTFKALPHQIGPRGDPNSAPPLAGKETSHRNVTGICDDPDKLAQFNELAATVKKDAKMETILVNVQLAPHSVVCMLYPVVNTEDFEDGIVMNNTGAIGHDLLNDPKRVAIARATVPAEGVVIAGPLTLIQGDTPVVKQAFIARLAINMEGYNITLDGVDYPCWGFAVILLNWEALKQQIGLSDVFRRLNMEFSLTRTDTLLNKTTDEFYEKVASIAQSNNSEILNDQNSIQVPLNTTNNEWLLRAGYESGFTPPWKTWGIASVTVGSLFISLMLMMLLITKQEQKNLLYRMMPPTIIKQLQKGETVIEKYNLATIFCSDIVGFTTLSGTMRPIQVMKMLNDLYTEFDKIVAKYKCYKVETIGDAYIVIGGGPDRCMGIEGAEKVAMFAIEATEFVKNYKTDEKESVQIRAGIHSGMVVAGVIGKTLPKYTLFGDTFSLAHKLESSGKQMKIQCSDTTFRLLRDARNHDFECVERRDGSSTGVYVKGMGTVQTWWIEGAEKLDKHRNRELMENVEDEYESMSVADHTVVTDNKQNLQQINLENEWIVSEAPPLMNNQMEVEMTNFNPQDGSVKMNDDEQCMKDGRHGGGVENDEDALSVEAVTNENPDNCL